MTYLPTIVDELLDAARDIKNVDLQTRAALFNRAADHLAGLCSSSGDRLPKSSATAVKGLRHTAETVPGLTAEQAAASMQSTAHMITATEMLAGRKANL